MQYKQKWLSIKVQNRRQVARITCSFIRQQLLRRGNIRACIMDIMCMEAYMRSAPRNPGEIRGLLGGSSGMIGQGMWVLDRPYNAARQWKVICLNTHKIQCTRVLGNLPMFVGELKKRKEQTIPETITRYHRRDSRAYPWGHAGRQGVAPMCHAHYWYR